MKFWLVFVLVLFIVISLIGTFCHVDPLKNEEVFPLEAEGAEREVVRFCFDQPPDEKEQMDAFGFNDKKQVVSLATNSPDVVFRRPLRAEEISLLFYLLVAFLDPDVPIEVRLVSVCFSSDEDDLIVFAAADVNLSRIVKTFRLSFLPECARFFACIPFSVKNSEIYADYERITLRCEQVDLPDVLLCYGCAAAFGEWEYKRFFGDAVGNVLKNTCFCG